MFKNQYKDFTVGQIEAALNIITDAGGIPALLRGDLEIKPKPLVFTKNQHGHYLIEVTGRALTGAEEVNHLTGRNFRIGDWARQCFLSDRPDSYDAKHRLEEGKIYTLALIPGREVGRQRTTANIQAYGRQCGYQKPVGGHIVRIRELVTDEQMKAMGFEYIAGLHDPITDSGGDPNVLHAYRRDGGRWLDAGWGFPDVKWDGSGAFAFLVPN